jgi:mannose/fructose/N-acetylgalactosamine-specific phosphotransferase system component IIC
LAILAGSRLLAVNQSSGGGDVLLNAIVAAVIGGALIIHAGYSPIFLIAAVAYALSTLLFVLYFRGYRKL